MSVFKRRYLLHNTTSHAPEPLWFPHGRFDTGDGVVGRGTITTHKTNVVDLNLQIHVQNISNHVKR